ncbi:hypothetical protein GGF32_008551 [Allomyces javanicus]|nr:hypothetical protein GGF32_008551 [Allomyces javanicus]
MTASSPTTAVPLEYLGTICRAADGSYQVLNMDEAELARFLEFMIAKQQGGTTRAADVSRPQISAGVNHVQEQDDAHEGKQRDLDSEVQPDDHHKGAGACSETRRSSAVSDSAPTSSRAVAQSVVPKSPDNNLATSSTASITAATSNTTMGNEDLIDLFANLNVSSTPSQHEEISLMHVTLNKKTMLSIHATREIKPCKRTVSLTGNWCTAALFDPETIWSGDWPVAWASIHGARSVIEDNSVYAVSVHDYDLNDEDAGSWAVTTPLRAVNLNPQDYTWFGFVPEAAWPQVNLIGVPRARADLIHQLRQDQNNNSSRDLYCPLLYNARTRTWFMDQHDKYFKVIKLGLVETSIQLDAQQSRWHRVKNTRGTKKWRIGV